MRRTEPPVHGVTKNGYSNYGCRCEPCTSAHAAATRVQHAARVGTLAADDPRHGKYTTYFNYGCRCSACKAARAEYNRIYRKRRAT